MMKRVAIVAVLVVPAAVAVGTSAGWTTQQPRGRALHDIGLRVSSQGVTRMLGPDSFCAALNGEPVTLACGGQMRAPRRAKLPVRLGRTITLRFGTAVGRVSVRYARAGKHGRLTALTYSMPLRAAGKDRDWHTVMSPDPPCSSAGPSSSSR